jgi:hypothetical protein
LTGRERDLVSSVFGEAIASAKVRIRRRRWHPLQPRDVTMAPCGHIHFPPASPFYCDDFALASLDRQGLFIHEMTPVWQAQTLGRFYLPLMRHPFCRYRYTLKSGWPLARYGIEQQAEIVRHGFLLRQGVTSAGVTDPAAYERLLDFSAG